MEQVVNAVRRNFCDLKPVLEALYIIGRYDLVEDRLGLCSDQILHKVGIWRYTFRKIFMLLLVNGRSYEFLYYVSRAI